MIAGLKFEDFELDFAAYELRRAGRVIRLERIPMEVLILLARRPNVLVTRAEVKALVWGSDVFLEHDAAINTAIRKIRRALGDDASQPRFIETVVGKGFRFIPRLTERTSPEAPGRPPSSIQSRLAEYRLMRGRRAFTLVSGENSIGRDPDSTVQVDHAAVSRRHARIVVVDPTATIEDLGSRNGTFVNGRRISRADLHDGAILGLGPIVLTVHIRWPSASTAPIRRPPRQRG
jgi:DNA-binding winged helix-turn-helix (wHTH) protein